MLAINRNPGFCKPEKVSFIELIEVFDATHLCADCLTIRTSRSRHCYVCNKCVERYDHHCPWINNCVGLNNHNSFYIFVGFMAALLAISLSQSFYTLVRMIQNGYAAFASTPVFLPRFPPAVYITLLALQILVAGFFLIPVTLLCFV